MVDSLVCLGRFCHGFFNKICDRERKPPYHACNIFINSFYDCTAEWLISCVSPRSFKFCLFHYFQLFYESRQTFTNPYSPSPSPSCFLLTPLQKKEKEKETLRLCFPQGVVACLCSFVVLWTVVFVLNDYNCIMMTCSSSEDCGTLVVDQHTLLDFNNSLLTWHF